MLVVIAYDVNTSDPAGIGRLRRVAKHCQNFGQRVQNSVFECILDQAQWLKFKHDLEALVDKEKDSLRYYRLGDHYQQKVGCFGCKQGYEAEGPLII